MLEGLGWCCILLANMSFHMCKCHVGCMIALDDVTYHCPTLLTKSAQALVDGVCHWITSMSLSRCIHTTSYICMPSMMLHVVVQCWFPSAHRQPQRREDPCWCILSLADVSYAEHACHKQRLPTDDNMPPMMCACFGWCFLPLDGVPWPLCVGQVLCPWVYPHRPRLMHAHICYFRLRWLMLFGWYTHVIGDVPCRLTQTTTQIALPMNIWHYVFMHALVDVACCWLILLSRCTYATAVHAYFTGVSCHLPRLLYRYSHSTSVCGGLWWSLIPLDDVTF